MTNPKTPDPRGLLDKRRLVFNQVVSAAVIILVYAFRFTKVGSATPPTWWLSVTTDFILPCLAVMWLYHRPGGARDEWQELRGSNLR